MADRKGPKFRGSSGLFREDTPKITMPLFAYFTRVGLALLALLLVLNSMVEPNEPKPEPAVAAIETYRARSTTGSAHQSEARNWNFVLHRSKSANYRLPDPTQEQQGSTDDTAPTAVRQVEPKSRPEKATVRKVRTRQFEPSAYSSYARATSYVSAAESRHAPW
jgi:hypothetical protein